MKYFMGILLLLIGSSTIITVEAIEYYGKFPPTEAWTTYTFNDQLITFETSMEARDWNRQLWITSDGSILFGTNNLSGIVNSFPTSNSTTPPASFVNCPDGFNYACINLINTFLLDQNFSSNVQIDGDLEVLGDCIGCGGSGTSQYNVTSSYIMSVNGLLVEAINGITGDVDFSDATGDAENVVQSAVDNLSEGGMIFFKAGVYNFTDTLGGGSKMVHITTDGITMTGEGHASVINMTDNGFMFYFTNVTGGTVSNLKFLGGEHPTEVYDENHGIAFLDSTYITVFNNYFENIGDEGVIFARMNMSSIYGNTFQNTTGGGGGGAINLQATNTTSILNNLIFDPSLNGIHIEQTASTKANHEITIANNVIVNASRYGIVATSTGFENRNNTDITIVGNVVTNAGQEGIRLAGSGDSTPKNILVVGNVVRDGGNSPVGTQRAAIIITQNTPPSNTLAVGNLVQDYGIESANRRGIQGFDIYVGNSVTGVGDNGFFVGSNQTVVGNQCFDNGVNGGASIRAGITMGSDNVVIGNVCRNTDVNNKVQTRGIQMAGDRNIVIGNNVLEGGNNENNWMDDDGELNFVKYNIGQQNWGTLFKVKTADETLTNSTVLQRDDELFLNVTKDTWYLAEAYIVVIGDSINADIDMNFECVGCTFANGDGWETILEQGTNALGMAGEASSEVSTFNRWSHVGYTFKTGTSDGYINLRWAMSVLQNEDIKVRDGSFIKLTYLGDA